jgi:hypothetical protein
MSNVAFTPLFVAVETIWMEETSAFVILALIEL